MAPKTRLINGERIDIATNKPYVSPLSSISPLTSNSSVINASDLENVKPLKLAEQPISHLASGIIESSVIESKAIQKQAQDELKRQQELQKTQREQQGIKGGMGKILEEMGMQGERESELTDEAGIPEKQKQLDEITNQIEAKELSIVRQIEKVEKSGGGLVSGQNIEIDRIQKEGARELADLSIIQNARNRNLSTAQSIVNQKIELQTEDLKNRFNTLKFFYDENKEMLTKKEDRDLQLATQKADREYQETREQFKILEEKKLELLSSAAEQGADNTILQAIQNAETPEEAIIAAGQYSGDMLDRKIKEAQLSSLTAPRMSVGGGSGGETGEIGDAVSIEQEQEADTAVKLIQNGQAKLADFKNEPTYKTIQNKLAGAPDPDALDKEFQRSILEGDIKKIDNLLTHKGKAGVTGPNTLSRLNPTDLNVFTAARDDFNAEIERLTGELTLDKLLAVKAAGGTLGALSNEELYLLAAAATKISGWKKYDYLQGRNIYKTTEKLMNAELQTIKSLKEKALKLSQDKSNLFNQPTSEGSEIEYLDILDEALQGDPYSMYDLN